MVFAPLLNLHVFTTLVITAWMVEAANASETSVESTLLNKAGDSHVYTRRRENLKHNFLFFS
jgi:hypothetical protein